MKPSLNKAEGDGPTLADLPRLGRGRILAVEAEGSTADRLRELGLTPGTTVRFQRRAPFGGPLVIELRGYSLCLRPSEARLVRLVASGAEPES